MINGAAIATEVIAAGTIAAGTYYFFFREKLPPAEATEPDIPQGDGVLGLVAISGPALDAPIMDAPPPPPIQQTPEHDTVGANIDDYIRRASGEQTTGEG